MRDIEFKAKRIDSYGATSGRWEIGYYWYTNNSRNIPIGGPPIIGTHYLHVWKAGDWGLGSWFDIEIDPETLCQFTGKYTKKNEWRIYEGDFIVKPGGFKGIYEVYWSQKHLGFKYRLVHGDPDWNPTKTLDDTVEIYGNKFDTPTWYPKEKAKWNRPEINPIYPEEWITFLGTDLDTDIYYVLDENKNSWIMQVTQHGHQLTRASEVLHNTLDSAKFNPDIYVYWLTEVFNRDLKYE